MLFRGGWAGVWAAEQHSLKPPSHYSPNSDRAERAFSSMQKLYDIFAKLSGGNAIIGGGLIFFAGGIAANAFNYVYRLAMGRMLGPEFFGELTALLSLVFIVAVPSDPFYSAAARFSAIFHTQGALEKLRVLFLYFMRVMALASGVLILATIVLHGTIQDFLQLSHISSIYLVVAIVAATFFGSFAKGMLLGLKRFAALSAVLVLESSARVAIAIILVGAGLLVGGALGGFLIPLIAGYAVTIYFLKNFLFSNTRSPSSMGEIGTQEKRAIWRYIFFSFLSFLFLNILLNVDIILVKHYFLAFDAGVYAGFSTLGRGVFIAVSLCAGILFPVVASRHSQQQNYIRPLWIACVASLGIAGVATTLLWAFPRQFIEIFFGATYIAGAEFLGFYGLAMGMFGFVYLLSYFFMALNQFRFLYILGAGSILEILLISRGHENFLQTIAMFSIALVAVLAGMIALALAEYRRLASRGV